MARILRGPVSINEVVNFVAATTEAYSHNKGYNWNQVAELNEISPTGINNYLADESGRLALPSSSDLNRGLAVGRSNSITPFSQPNALSVYISNEHHRYSDRLSIRTEVINLSALRDQAFGQTFSASAKEFLIRADYVSHDKADFEKYLDYMTLEAQDRLQQGVAFAAFKMIKHLS